MDDYLFALGEIHRVLRPGGRFLLGVPYLTLTEYNLVNPYHRQHFNEHSFSFFDPERLKGSAAEENPILFAKVFHRYHYMGLYHLLPWPLRGWCRRHLFNVVRKIDFGLLKIDPTRERPRVSAALRRETLREFCACLASRVPYEGTGCRIGRRPGPGHALRVARAWWKGLD